MSTKSRESIYGTTIRMSAERAKEARKEADRLACEAWNYRMLGYRGPAQPSPTLGDTLNAGYPYLEVRCLGCDTHQTAALDVVRRPKTTPIHELDRCMRCNTHTHSDVYLLSLLRSGHSRRDRKLLWLGSAANDPNPTRRNCLPMMTAD